MSEIVVQMGEEEGLFQVFAEKNEITFSTAVLDHIEYMPPSVKSYLEKMTDELRMKKLYLDYVSDQKMIYLKGEWRFSDMEADVFDRLIIALQETSADIKMDLYKACCKDLIYVVAYKSYQNII